jgi:glycosyltransferase involved in cell wall biosynthesis
LKKIRIACLPVAGIGNPYQFLMMQGLNRSGKMEAFNGVNDRFFGIFRTCLRYRPNVIHFDWETSYYYRKYLLLTLAGLPLFMLQILLARYAFGVKLVWTPHNIQPHDLPQPGLHRFVRRFFASQMQWLRLFSESSLPAAMEEFQQKKEAFRIQPEGSYVGWYPEMESLNGGLRKQLGIPENHKVLLYLGLIKPYKGVLELIQSFASMKSRSTSLLICGKSMNAIYLEKIRMAAAGNPDILIREGFVPENLLPDFYGLASAVILPFKKIENSGSVIMAMGYKKAVLAPEMGVLKQRLCRQPQLLFRNNPEEALLTFASLSQAELERIGQENYEEVNRYRWEDFANCISETGLPS